MPAVTVGSKRWGYRITILITVWALYVINHLDRMSVLTLLPFIRKDLGLTHETIGFAASLFFFAYALAQLPAGMLADKFGPKKVMTFSILVFTVFVFLTGKVNSLWSFIAARLGLGLGEGFHFVPSIKTVSDWFPKKEKGRASSFFMTSVIVAPAICSVLVTWIAASWGWRAAFNVLAVPGIIGLFVLLYFMIDTPQKAFKEGKVTKEELDYITQDISTDKAENKPRVGFKEIAKDPQLWFITGVVFAKTSCHWGTSAWLSSFLIEQHGFNIKTMGLLAALPWVVGLLSAATSGTMLDKVTKSKSKPLLMAAFIGLALVLFFVPMIPKGDIPLLVIGLALQGFFVVFYDGPIYSYIQLRYPKELVGTATGVNQLFGQFGSFVAPTLAGFLIVAGAGGTANYTNVFHLFMGIAIFGIICSLALKETPFVLKKSEEIKQVTV